MAETRNKRLARKLDVETRQNASRYWAEKAVKIRVCSHGKAFNEPCISCRRDRMEHPTPDQEGHYWAKLKLADNPDHNSVDWEVVQVFDNIARPWCEADIEGGECQLVHVPGMERGQSIDAFVWGPRVELPSELRP